MAGGVTVCVLLVSVLAVGSSSSTDQLLPEDTAYEMITEYRDNYPPPNLPYAYDALEPFVNEATLKVHHQGHHRAYCTKMNAALKEWRKQVEPGGAQSRFIAHQRGAGLVHSTNGI